MAYRRAQWTGRRFSTSRNPRRAPRARAGAGRNGTAAWRTSVRREQDRAVVVAGAPAQGGGGVVEEPYARDRVNGDLVERVQPTEQTAVQIHPDTVRRERVIVGTQHAQQLRDRTGGRRPDLVRGNRPRGDRPLGLQPPRGRRTALGTAAADQRAGE